MGKRFLILIVSLLVVFINAGAADCTVTGPTSSTTVCLSGSVTLNVSPGGGTAPFTYQWYSNTVNDNTTGTIIGGANNASYSPSTSTAGTIYYYCTVSSSTCTLVTSSTGEVTVNPLPTISGTLTVCAGSTTTLSGSGTPDVTTPWSSASPGIATVAIDGEVTGVSSGTSIITYKDSNGCTNTATVTVNPLPTVSGTLSVCVGSTTPLSGSGTPDVTTPWSSASPLIATVTSGGVVSGLLAGTSDITYKNSNGCTKTVTVTVNAIPAAPTGNASQSFCDGATVADLTTTSGSGIKWYSAAVGGSLYISTDLLTTATHYYASQTVTGCESSNRLDVTVTINPLPTISGTLSVCEGSTTTLSGSGTPDGTTPWSSASPGIATVTNVGVVTGVSAGTSVITYKDINGCTNTATVTVNPIPVPVITGPSSVCITSSTTYNTAAGKTSYDWEFTGGTISGGGDGNNSITITWNSLGAKTVSVAYTSLGCPAASPTVYNITVLDKPSPSNVQVSGTLKKGQTISTTYDYVQGVCFAEDLTKTEIRWYRNTVASGTGSMITMKFATDKTYNLVNDDKNMYIRVGIKLSDGSSLRNEVFGSWVGPVGDNAPVATNVNIVGNPRSGLPLYGTYTYVDEENDPQGASVLKWYRADNAAGTTNKSEIYTGNSYNIDHSLITKYIGFEVTPVATQGTPTGVPVITNPFAGPVLNSTPVATAVGIAGILQAGQVLNGLYTYNDTEGDLESGSTYKWFSSTTSGGTFTATGETGKSRIITLADQGKYFKFSVIPKAATGTPDTTEYLSPESGRINSQPAATVGSITTATTFEVGKELTGHYTLSDADSDPTSATFRWLRTGGLEITGATSDKYTLTPDDEGYTITFEVTPQSSSGYPTTGDIALSPPTEVIPISPSSPKPIATDVCIQGIRADGQVLTARYTYSYTRSEGPSVRKWYRGTTEIGSGLTYTLNSTDIASTQEITFEVTPVSTGSPSQGTKVTSSALARITLSQVTYFNNSEPVTLTVNQAGGVFSGPYVTSGIFSPQDAGIGGPYTIKYDYSIVNTSNTCTQQASKDLNVITALTSFSPIKSVYCRDDAPFLVTVITLPVNSRPYTYITEYYGFYVNSAYGDQSAVGSEIITNPYDGITGWSVMIDPSTLIVGVNYLNLYYYDDLNRLNRLYKSFVVEQVGTLTEISNLSDAYCAEDGMREITVYGLYPSGGFAAWTCTGPSNMLTDKTQLTAKLYPQNGLPSPTPYLITYQYTTPNLCKSNILTKQVTINPMPVVDFSVDPFFNIDGGGVDLVPDVAPLPLYDASFVGPGVVKTDDGFGNYTFKFLPSIADVGSKTIEYKVTTDKGCYDATSNPTYVEKASGTFNGLSDKICYSDQTYTVTISNLPDDTYACSPIKFWNKKNSFLTLGALTAQYNIAAARAGYDTLFFTYRKRSVDFTIRKAVFIDSIGKIQITGLNDNYCDYAGTATLRVLVENSTGSGNFSYSGPGIAFANYGLLADFFPSKAPTGTPFTVSYTHTSTVNNSGCTKIESLPVTVNKSPDVSIFNSRVTVNIKETPLVLSGSPAAGLFSGKGVYKSGTDYVFDPVVAGLGDIEFMISYTDSKGCLATKKDTLIVTAASGSILGINANNQYCYDGLKDTLIYTSSKPWYNGSFSGPGVTDLASAKAVFDPAAAGKGDQNIVFTYSDAYGTVFDVSAKVNVDSLGVVEIKPVAAGDEYCNNDAPFELITTPRGGVFTGPVTTGYLNPSKALGDTAVTYTYLNVRTGCTITGRIPFRIHPAPVVSFAPSDNCIENKFDSIRFINNTASSDPVSSWLWTFSDIGGTDLSSKEKPAYIFKSGGQHLITLTATTINSCVVKKDLTIDLGVKPVADFYWKNECFVPGDSVLLIDNTEWTSPIVSRSWNFFDGAPLKTGTELKYPKNAVGAIPVQYIVNTAYANCSDTVTKNIYVRPNIILSPDGYFENFESGNGGWTKGDESINSWSFGTPDRTTIKSAASGSAAWFTRFDPVRQESSSVVSPCFNFSFIERPMIGLALKRNFNKDRDGAALQYRIGDAGSWQYVGSVDDGINWYNSTLIKGRPGGDQIGWTTSSADQNWIEARHTLDELKGKKNVKFRIAYGSDGNAQDNDGLAFDDIFIGERKRNVLLEHFTNTSSSRSSEANAMINAIDIANDKDIVNIQYHTNFPGIDSFYVDNPGDASARILYYGLTKTPYSFVDGGTRKEYSAIFDYPIAFDNTLAPINSNEIIKRGLISPKFDIRLDSLVVSGGVLTISGKITSLATDTISNLSLYLAVIEKANSKYRGAAGETLFRNVFRKFIPDAAGINLPKLWTKGVAVPMQDQTWIIYKTLNSSDIEVVAFIQNTVTKEVYQAASMLKPKITVGIEKPGILNNIDFALYPNPARHQLTVSFGEILNISTDIFIYDFSGTIVRTFKAGPGESEYVIDDLGLKDGIYLIRVSSGVNFGFKKLIISGS